MIADIGTYTFDELLLRYSYMALKANLGVPTAVYSPDVSPASGMRVNKARTVALDTDIPLGMACLA
jgi:hypothetical protein